MAWWRSGRPNPRKRELARHLLDGGNPAAALRILAGSCFGAGFDADYFELLGRALLACGQEANAGRFLFLSGIRQPEYLPVITRYLSLHHNPKNFRQLQSQFPMRVRVMWRLSQFPTVVADELRTLGWPEDTQAAIMERRQQSQQKRKS